MMAKFHLMIGVYVSREDHARIKFRAWQERKTVSDWARELLLDALEKPATRNISFEAEKLNGIGGQSCSGTSA
jgi:hypothetical protein